MQVERVKVGFGTTINLGNFNSMRLDVEYEARIETGEDADEVIGALHNQAVAEVKRQASDRRKAAE